MEQSASLEDTSCSANQEILRLLWIPNDYCREKSGIMYTRSVCPEPD